VRFCSALTLLAQRIDDVGPLTLGTASRRLAFSRESAGRRDAVASQFNFDNRHSRKAGRAFALALSWVKPAM
jgi:hypothetical protein